MVGEGLHNLGHLSPSLLMASLAIICSGMTEVVVNAGTVVVLLPMFASLVSKINGVSAKSTVPVSFVPGYFFSKPLHPS